MKRSLAALILTSICTGGAQAMPADLLDLALLKPTGQYSVAYKDYHWIDESRCPDVNYHNNKQDYSANNPTHCREITARTYYPIAATEEPGNSYYKPFIEHETALMSQVPNITNTEKSMLAKIKSYTFSNRPIISNKQFPVILFAPGFTFPAQSYENTITDLVSHGYIVIGINSPFINLTALPNGHVVNPTSTHDLTVIEKTYVPMERSDIAYVYARIHAEHRNDTIFNAMDLHRIGGVGHSVGARVIADTAHAHPQWFNAGATLDIGFDLTGDSQKRFDMPFMHEIGANRSTAEPDEPIHFELGKHGYVVTLSPSIVNVDYSKHMNFGDYSTLQYLPAYTKTFTFFKQFGMDIIGDGNGIEIARASSDYLIQFFDMYLKNKTSNLFKNCETRDSNSLINCG